METAYAPLAVDERERRFTKRCRTCLWSLYQTDAILLKWFLYFLLASNLYFCFTFLVFYGLFNTYGVSIPIRMNVTVHLEPSEVLT